MGATTDILGLYKPADEERNWGVNKVTENFDIIDDNVGVSDHLKELTPNHGIVADNRLDTHDADADAIGDNFKILMMLYGG